MDLYRLALEVIPMIYLHTRWIHESSDDPVDLYAELDDDRFEVRKVEVFRNGSLGFANENESVNGTRLGEVAIPGIEAIDADPQFISESMTVREFENLWAEARV